MAAGSIKRPTLGKACRAGRRQGVLTVQAAKKSSSPWSSGGPKRGSGKGDSSSGSGGGAGSDNTGSSGANGKKASGTNSGPSNPSGNPWKDSPTRQGLPSRPSKGGGFGAGASGGGGAGRSSSSSSSNSSRSSSSIGRLGAAGVGVGSGRLAARLAQPPEVTFTDPINVTLLDELSPPEPAAEPKWGTFCSHLSGEWVGQYAAYTPWEGKPEPAWLDERGKYINVVYTRALEQRVRDERPASRGQEPGVRDERPASRGQEPGVTEGKGPMSGPVGDLLIRKIGRCTQQAALPSLRLKPLQAAPSGALEPAAAGDDVAEGEDDDVDLEALGFNSDGVVVFDGGSYSAGPEYVGQQPIKLVNDEDILRLSDSEEEGEREDGLKARVRSGAAASTSALAAARRGAGKAVGGRVGDGGDVGGQEGAALESGGGPEEEEEADDDDVGEDEESTLLPTSTSVLEQCLVDWGSRTRMRLKLTLRIGQLESGEVDVEVLRILLFLEEWVGPAPATADTLPSAPDQVKVLAAPCTELPRPTPAQLQGSWNVFTVTATGLDELDPASGEERVVWVYGSTEEQQLWDTSSAPPSGEDGGCFWLPGGVVLSLRMVDNYVPVDLDDDSGSSERGGGRAAASAVASNGNGNGNSNGTGKVERTYPRGLCLGLAWLWREGSVSLMEREYDGYGYLREVRLSQAVKGGWSGSRM